MKTNIVLIFSALFTKAVNGAAISARQSYTLNQNGIVWDPSCKEKISEENHETRQQFLTRAMEGAIEMADNAWTRFNTKTYKELKDQCEAPDSKLQKTVDGNDPAYTQFFGMQWKDEGLEQIKLVLDRMANTWNQDQGKANRPSGAEGKLTIYCNEDYKSQDGESKCDEGMQAQIASDLDGKTMKQDNYRLEVCPAFYEVTRFDELKKAITAKDAESAGVSESVYEQAQNMFVVENEGCDAHVMYHEISHIQWVGNTNKHVKKSTNGKQTFEQDPDEIYSWDETNLKAKKVLGQNNPTEITENADSYAWYAGYGYFCNKAGKEIWNDKSEGPKEINVPIDWAKAGKKNIGKA